MRDFYTAYYRAVKTSRAHARFCESAYGKDLCQHGFMTMDDLEFLVRVARWSSHHRVLDVGCGNGKIAQWIAGVTGAQVDGMDHIPSAIECASALETHSKFFVADLTKLPCAPNSYDALLSVDTLYFSSDYCDTLKQWARCVKPGGHMLIFFSHGANPDHPKATFDPSTLPPQRTPCGVALGALGLTFRTWDFTAADYALARRKKEILGAHRNEFLAEGHLDLLENRCGEAAGIMDAVESGMHARYLYDVQIYAGSESAFD